MLEDIVVFLTVNQSLVVRGKTIKFVLSIEFVLVLFFRKDFLGAQYRLMHGVLH